VLSTADPWQDHHRAFGDLWRRRIGRPRQFWLRTIENNLCVTNESWFGDGKAACTGSVGMAATRDNGHVDDKLLNDDDDDDDD